MQHSAEFSSLTQYQADLDRASVEIERRAALDAQRDSLQTGGARSFASPRTSFRAVAH